MQLKSHADLTQTLRFLLQATIVVTAAAIPAGLFEYHTYANLPPGLDPNETMLPADLVSLAVGGVQVLLGLATGITFLRWIYRSNQNLGALSGQAMRFTPGWAVGWYFVPIANLVKPYQAMQEIWQVSHRDPAASPGLLSAWWTLWILSTVVGRAAVKLVLAAEDASAYASSAIVYALSDAVDVGLAVAALLLVTRIGEAYARNFGERPTEPPPAIVP